MGKAAHSNRLIRPPVLLSCASFLIVLSLRFQDFKVDLMNIIKYARDEPAWLFMVMPRNTDSSFILSTAKVSNGPEN